MTDRPAARRPLRILVNGMHAKSGGGLTYLRNILPELAEDNGLELHLFLHRDQMDYLYPLDERVRIHLFDFPGNVLRLLAWEQFVLPVLARVMGAEVTLSPANYGPLAAPNSVIMLRNSLAVAGRETRIAKRLYWLALAMMTALSLLACRRAIAVSEYARRALTFGMERWFVERVAVIHHGVTPFFSPGVSSRGSFLLVVGDLYIQKNVHTLLLVMAELREAFPHVTLRIAGQAADSGYERELRRLVAVHRLENHVQFLGSIDTVAVRSLYRECMALVFPSTVETFGNPLVEAMACGAPVACSDRAAMPEIAGDAALYFDPLSRTEMKHVLTRLIQDEGLRADLSRRGLQRARAYSWRQTADATARLLRSAARNTG